MNLICRLERVSRPRLTFLLGHRLSNMVFGVLVVGGSAGALFAPPFTGLDTLPALGVVLLSLGVLLEDILVVIAARVVGVAGVAGVAGDRARKRRHSRHRIALLELEAQFATTVWAAPSRLSLSRQQAHLGRQ
jgi:hypothetical protein